MCRMRADKWTRQELTLDITVGGFDPGHSGSSREQDRAGPRPSRESFLISPGQFRSVWCCVWSHSRWENGRRQRKMDPCSCVTPASTCWNVWILLRSNTNPPSSALCSKVSLRGTSALCVASLCTLLSSVSLILIDTKASACRYQPSMSLRNENFPTFRWQLYVPVPLSGLPADLWSWQHAVAFDFWATLTVCRLAKGCLKADQSKRGLKAGVQLGEDQKRHKL